MRMFKCEVLWLVIMSIFLPSTVFAEDIVWFKSPITTSLRISNGLYVRDHRSADRVIGSINGYGAVTLTGFIKTLVEYPKYEGCSTCSKHYLGIVSEGKSGDLHTISMVEDCYYTNINNFTIFDIQDKHSVNFFLGCTSK